MISIQNEIIDLKKQFNIPILAHYYQPFEIQEVADYLGDSLGLSRIAKNEIKNDQFIFAGVIFMAETASVLNQDKNVLVPSKMAHCGLADFLTGEQLDEYKQKYPDAPVVTYVNSTSAAKAKSDCCCTSSNSIDIVKKIKKEYNAEYILFGPDANLGDYVEQHTGIDLIKMPSEGHCYVHSQLTADDIQSAKAEHPEASVLVHPECRREVRDLADVVGSTAQMYNAVEKSSDDEDVFLIGTEKGLMARMEDDFPEKRFYLVSEDLICKDMKKNSLELIKDIFNHLHDGTYEVKVAPNIAEQAMKPINKMLKYSE
ncbi:MAG: quinolinate synthase NadA [Promethearchaeia archaeon]